ncbi:Arc family DNA-binding protein [Ruminococcaceae bacterium OttesenSCG-928-L11]|nr:Arc family DNA-binding protein [Ruminococcaceae bacterium OttesenSCG-928-L11]
MKDTMPRYTLRVPRELLDKIKYIAGAEARTTNKEIEWILLEKVAEYEAKHGEIKLGEK